MTSRPVLVLTGSLDLSHILMSALPKSHFRPVGVVWTRAGKKGSFECWKTSFAFPPVHLSGTITRQRGGDEIMAEPMTAAITGPLSPCSKSGHAAYKLSASSP